MKEWGKLKNTEKGVLTKGENRVIIKIQTKERGEMMALLIKNKLVSLSGSSYVLDENGNKIFEIRGCFPSPTRKKHIYDMKGNLLYTVRNKYWHFFRKSAYILDGRRGDDEKVCRLKERFFIGWDFIDSRENLKMEGKFLQGLHIIKKGTTIGKFYRKHNAATFFVDTHDMYCLEVYNAQEAAFLVAVVIAYDNVCDARER